LRPKQHAMKKIHIILLLLVIGGIVGMSFFIKDLTTYETFSSAAEKKDKFVVVKVKLDKAAPIEFDMVKDPNKTVFYAFDQSGARTRVVYNNAKPTDMERSEGIDLNGYMRGDHFECTKLQMKCPSKYKDDMKQAEKNLPTAATQAVPANY
jgi:cytochrome c-type biogenesis protein CcmE